MANVVTHSSVRCHATADDPPPRLTRDLLPVADAKRPLRLGERVGGQRIQKQAGHFHPAGVAGVDAVPATRLGAIACIVKSLGKHGGLGVTVVP